MNACIRERLAVKIYLADTPQRENGLMNACINKHVFEVGSEQLQ